MLNNNSKGSSAGSALILALYSAYYKIAIPSNVAITGTISNNGEITKIGGLREKMLCAFKNETEILIMPESNYRENLTFPITYFERLKKVCPVSSYKDLISLLYQWKNCINLN